MPAQLVALNDGPGILVDKPILLLGRHPECDVQIESRKISRRHCCIAQVNDYLVVRDLDSTNGIRINGVRVVEGRLDPGDELTIGNFRYRVTWDDAPVGQPPVPQARPQAPPPIQPVEIDDDELLESSDEPVLLPEPLPRSVPLVRPPTKSRPPGPPPLPGSHDGGVLPDHLELLPGSGSVQGPGQGPKS